jgi:hypothetical protein
MTAVFRGTDAAETINGTSGADEIYGYGGNDTLTGAAGSDTLIGGLGDDRLEGGAGNDTYVWEGGDGKDTVYDNSGTNVLKIGEDVDQTVFTLTRSGNNLVIEFNDESVGGVTLERWYSGSSYQLSSIEFADGTVWSRADITAIAAGTKTPFRSASAFGGITAAGSAGNAGIRWLSGEELAGIMGGQEWQTSDDGDDFDGSGGGCDAGALGMIALMVALGSKTLFHIKRN